MKNIICFVFLFNIFDHFECINSNQSWATLKALNRQSYISNDEIIDFNIHLSTITPQLSSLPIIHHHLQPNLHIIKFQTNYRLRKFNSEMIEHTKHEGKNIKWLTLKKTSLMKHGSHVPKPTPSDPATPRGRLRAF